MPIALSLERRPVMPFGYGAIVSLGPVNTSWVAATEPLFAVSKASRAPCGRATPASDNAGEREQGPVPSGCDLKSVQAALLVVHLIHQTTLLAPCLVGFQIATLRSRKG